MLNIIFPCLPYSRTIDPMWQDEAEEARRLGHAVCLYDADQPKLYPPWPLPTQLTLYRGWMLSETEYCQLHALTPLLVIPEYYLASHRADGWYAAIEPFTPHSVFVPASESVAVVEELLKRDGCCFIKRLTKSFGADSTIASIDEFQALIQKHKIDAAEVLFVREFVKLSDQPEARFFAVKGVAYGANSQSLPAALQPVLQQLQNRWFYTIDVAYTAEGKPLIIEIGDGQVSDTKEWLVADLYQTVIAEIIKS